MTERYTYLYHLPRDLYAPGCPVLIAAGALVRDNHTDRYLAQLKLQRISGKPIRSVTVEILPLDAQGRVSVGPVLCAYPCRAARDEFFGGQRGIPLSDRLDKEIHILIIRIGFLEGIDLSFGKLYGIICNPDLDLLRHRQMGKRRQKNSCCAGSCQAFYPSLCRFCHNTSPFL